MMKKLAEILQEGSIVRKKQRGITLIALVVTIIVPYDKNTKRFNIKGFLHFGYIKRWVKSLSFFNS